VSATVTFNGWGEFQSKLKSLPQVLFDEFDGECMDAANEWEQLAKNDAPVDFGYLRQNIVPKQIGLMHYEVTSNALYSAYREWGTGSLVSVPPDLADYVIQFKGKGLRVVNSRPQPYFFVQQPIVEKNLFERIKNILNTEH
jgi:hypothetical protein